jgi:hypothetical protein
MAWKRSFKCRLAVLLLLLFLSLAVILRHYRFGYRFGYFNAIHTCAQNPACVACTFARRIQTFDI